MEIKAGYVRKQIYKAYKYQNGRKTFKTFDLLRCSHSFFKRRITHQVYGHETLDNCGSICLIGKCLPQPNFNILDEHAMKKSFGWMNLKPMCIKESDTKRAKFDNRLYSMQDLKAYQFIKINEDGLNQDFY